MLAIGFASAQLAGCSSSKTITDLGSSDSVTETRTGQPGACTVDDHCASLTTNCGKGVCDAVTEQCAVEHRPYGSKCIPDLPCALGICAEGQCQPELVLQCDDGNPCTTDLCDIDKDGCIHTAREADCDDGNPCTEDDQCGDGTCVGGTYVCLQCTLDEDCAIYNDGDACNGVLTCDTTTSHCHVAPGTKVICLPSKPCISAHCDAFTGACVETPKANGQPCHDGDLCTLEDRCKEGLCQGASLMCPGSQGSCQSTLCTKKGACDVTPLTGQPCVDGNQCTNNDACSDGVCAGLVAENCACSEDADCTLYDDDDWCTGVVRCIAGSCQIDPTTVVNCPLPSAPCISIQCVPDTGECVTLNLDGPCADGDLCTANDQCVDGFCQGEAVPCDDMDDCTNDLCVPSMGCVVEFIAGCEPEGCTNGTVGLCGKCGTRLCLGNEWGPCENQKTCLGGTTETEACGNCGEQSRSCSDECEWNEWSPCASEGACTPGKNEVQTCGPCDTQQRTCGSECEWSDWGQCSEEGICTPGETQSQGCGNCGNQLQTCTDQCMWGDWNTCTDQGACSPGESQSQGCGNCGTQTRTCNGNCGWDGWSGCSDQGACSPGESQSHRNSVF